MKTLKQLKSEKSKIRKQLCAISDEIKEMELKLELPKLKKQYEGKYWKYKNGNGSYSWFLYSFCKSVIDDDQAIFDCFESGTTIFDETRHVFSHNIKNHYFVCETEITKEQYLRELNKVSAKLTKLSH